MSFQSSINIFTAAGMPGDLAYSGPVRATPYNLFSDGQAQTCGFAFTVTNGANADPTVAQGGSPNAGTAQVGGTGVFAGILVNPKEYALYGTSGAPLGATLNLPDNSVGSLLDMGFIWAKLTNATASVGDEVYYDNTTGALTSQAPIAAFTASQTTTVLTVSAITAGNLGIGSVVNTGSAQVRIVSLGTGTGGTGTYNVDISQSVSSGDMTASSVAPSGKTLVPNCTVNRFDISAAGLAVLKLTN